VDVAHVHAQPGQHPHGLHHRVGYVVELQVEEYPVPPGLDVPHYLRALGIEELHADLYKGFFLAEQREKVHSFVPAREVAGDYYIFCHINAPFRLYPEVL